MAENPLDRYQYVDQPPRDGSQVDATDVTVITGSRQTGGAGTFWTNPFEAEIPEDC